MKYLCAELKEPIMAVVKIDVDFNKNLLNAVLVVNDMKVKTFLEIKQAMHEKIATLSLEDIKFVIKE